MRELVIDVSHIDKNIDLSAWKARRGIWGVIVKVGGYEVIDRTKGYPEKFENSWYKRHCDSVSSLNLHMGGYYYSVATDVETARRNADHFADLLRRYGYRFDLPLYVDVEDPTQLSIGRRALTDVITAFIKRVRENGFNCGLYTSRSALTECMYGKELEGYPLWIAEYSDRCRTDIAHGMWQFGAMNLDGDVFWGDKAGYVDSNWCYVDYPNEETGLVSRPTIDVANVAALIHFDMVTDPRNGYSQAPHRWGGDHPDGSKVLDIDGRRYTYKLGSYDCSSSVITAWRQAIRYTKYEGKLDTASYTGDMRSVFVRSGLFEANFSPAKRGDVYLAEEKHTAMCQDGGRDGTFGYDCLSEFNRNEQHAATGGVVGDQDGYESIVRGYYDDGWNTVLHYVGGRLEDMTHDDDGGDIKEANMAPMLFHKEGSGVYYWNGDIQSVPFHVRTEDEKKALVDIYAANGVKLELRKVSAATFDALMSMTKDRKSWVEGGIVSALADAEASSAEK